MKRSTTLLTTIILATFICASCYYDNEEALYPTLSSACDTLNVSFSGTIVPILANSCFSCHSNSTAASAGNNIHLENWTDVSAKATAIQGSIKHTGSFSPMPKNGGMIKACSINQFDIWVRAGMLNN